MVYIPLNRCPGPCQSTTASKAVGHHGTTQRGAGAFLDIERHDVVYWCYVC